MTRASGYVGETKNQPTKATTTPSSAQEALDLLAQTEHGGLCGCGYRESLHKVSGQGGAYCELAKVRHVLLTLVEENQQLRSQLAELGCKYYDEQDGVTPGWRNERAEALQAELVAANEMLDRKTGLIADLTTACHVHADGARRWKEKLTTTEAERDTLLARLEGLQDAVGTFTAFFRERHYGRMPSEVEEGLNQLDALRGKE